MWVSPNWSSCFVLFGHCCDFFQEYCNFEAKKFFWSKILKKYIFLKNLFYFKFLDILFLLLFKGSNLSARAFETVILGIYKKKNLFFRFFGLFWGGVRIGQIFFCVNSVYFGPVYTKTCVELRKLKSDILKSPYLSHFPMLYM